MSYYDSNHPEITQLIRLSLQNSWDIFRNLPWEESISPEKTFDKSYHSLLEKLPEYGKLSSDQQSILKAKENAYHVSNLLAGEYKAVCIASKVLTDCSEESPEWVPYLSILAAEETKHFVALSRYLNEKIQMCFEPHPRIKEILEALMMEEAYEVRLFIAQAVLEWTAASLLSSMLFRSREKLLQGIVKNILQDEGRHLNFNHIVFSRLSPNQSSKMKKMKEDLLFEAIMACAASLCAIPVWQEYGFSEKSCRQYATDEMTQRGVFKFFSRILPKEMSRCGLYSERLVGFIEQDLPQRLVKDSWSFEPKEASLSIS